MEHTTGLKTQRLFFAHEGRPYELIGYSYSNNTTIAVVRDLIDDESIKIVPNEVIETEFKPITQREVFDYIDNENDDEHAEMMQSIGIGYICPFCGGRLAWESDFMASEVRGMEGGYVEVCNEDDIEMIYRHEDEYCRGGLMGETDDIEKLNEQVEQSGEYQYMYIKENKIVNGEKTVKYWQINDSVIGIYTCLNCGKNYEVMDCPPSEEYRYPFFN